MYIILWKSRFEAEYKSLSTTVLYSTFEEAKEEVIRCRQIFSMLDYQIFRLVPVFEFIPAKELEDK
jgi:hypothetical protein